jgi:hypothetical protein
LNLNPGNFDGSTPIYSCGESRLLISWCAGDRCNIAGNDKDHGRSRSPSAEDRGCSKIGQVLASQMIDRSNDVVCSLHRAQGDKARRFLGLASKPRLMVSPGLASKSVALGFPVWASKLTSMVW